MALHEARGGKVVRSGNTGYGEESKFFVSPEINGKSPAKSRKGFARIPESSESEGHKKRSAL